MIAGSKTTARFASRVKLTEATGRKRRMYRKRRESCGSASGAEFLLRNHQAAHRPGKPARCSGAAKREAPAENG
ncbi:unnamed protein product, partial [Amoebophrya sp. A120]|eukprot:GSA120T00024855001.1